MIQRRKLSDTLTVLAGVFVFWTILATPTALGVFLYGHDYNAAFIGALAGSGPLGVAICGSLAIVCHPANKFGD